MKFCSIFLVLLGSVITQGLIGGARSETPVQICDKATLPERDFLTCEGGRLRAEGQALLDQAKAQIASGNKIGADCEALKDNEEARDCNLLSSDLFEDATFKRAMAADILDQADRVDARAADMRKAK
ncbi:MAG: hypothetical protein ABL951_11500 [Alphaproteobacteria bacterium]